jgi:hypothetical protein
MHSVYYDSMAQYWGYKESHRQDSAKTKKKNSGVNRRKVQYVIDSHPPLDVGVI